MRYTFFLSTPRLRFPESFLADEHDNPKQSILKLLKIMPDERRREVEVFEMLYEAWPHLKPPKKPTLLGRLVVGEGGHPSSRVYSRLLVCSLVQTQSSPSEGLVLMFGAARLSEDWSTAVLDTR